MTHESANVAKLTSAAADGSGFDRRRLDAVWFWPHPGD